MNMMIEINEHEQAVILAALEKRAEAIEKLKVTEEGKFWLSKIKQVIEKIRVK